MTAYIGISAYVAIIGLCRFTSPYTAISPCIAIYRHIAIQAPKYHHISPYIVTYHRTLAYVAMYCHISPHTLPHITISHFFGISRYIDIHHTTLCFPVHWHILPYIPYITIYHHLSVKIGMHRHRHISAYIGILAYIATYRSVSPYIGISPHIRMYQYLSPCIDKCIGVYRHISAYRQISAYMPCFGTYRYAISTVYWHISPNIGMLADNPVCRHISPYLGLYRHILVVYMAIYRRCIGIYRHKSAYRQNINIY